MYNNVILLNLSGGDTPKNKERLLTVPEFDNLPLSACFSSFLSSFASYSLDSVTGKRHPVWSLRDGLLCMCPTFSFLSILN